MGFNYIVYIPIAVKTLQDLVTTVSVGVKENHGYVALHTPVI